MYCKKCGANIGDEELDFCPFCGESLKREEKKAEKQEEDIFEIKSDEVKVEKKQAKCWAIFEKIGWILGIISIAGCWIPFLGLFTGLSTGSTGIVFAILGKQNKTPKYNFSKSLTFNIIGTVVGFFGYFILIFLLAFFAGL